jgi:hypothetical protein
MLLPMDPGQFIDECVCRGYLGLLKWPRKGIHTVFRLGKHAAKHGHLDVYKYIFAGVHLYWRDRDALKQAAKYGHLELVKYLTPRSECTPEKLGKIMCKSLSRGHVHIAKYLSHKTCALDNGMVSSAIKSGNIAIVRDLIENGHVVTDCAFYYAARQHSREMLEFIASSKPMNYRAVIGALKSNDAELAEWVFGRLSNKQRRKLSSKAFKAGTVEAINWALNHSLPRSNLKGGLWKAAIKAGDILALERIAALGQRMIPEAHLLAVLHNKPEVTNWLLDQKSKSLRCEFNTRLYLQVAKKSKHNMIHNLAYLRAFDCPMDAAESQKIYTELAERDKRPSKSRKTRIIILALYRTGLPLDLANLAMDASLGEWADKKILKCAKKKKTKKRTEEQRIGRVWATILSITIVVFIIALFTLLKLICGGQSCNPVIAIFALFACGLLMVAGIAIILVLIVESICW